MQLLITRPEEDAAGLAEKLAARGHRAWAFPLLAIVPRGDVAIPDRPWQAIAVTSANGIRAATGRDTLKAIRTLTVGPQSLAAAREAGFTAAEAHGGDVAGLAAFIAANLKPADGPILYLSGAETSGDLEGRLGARGFACHRAIVYDAVAAGDAARLDQLLPGIDAVLLYSPRSARIWRDLMAEPGRLAAAARPTYVCLSETVARSLPDTWRVRVANSPDEAAMLALLDDMSAKG